MVVASVSLAGAVANNVPLFSQRHARHVGHKLSVLFNKSTLNPNLSPGADTIYAGTPSLLIGMGGVDTLDAGHGIIQFHSPRNEGHDQDTIFGANTTFGGASISFAAAGNLTLPGGGQIDLTPADPDRVNSAPGATEGIATVFGSALAGDLLVLHDHPPASPPPDPHSPDGKPAPDLLLGWSFGRAGYTMDLGDPPGHDTAANPPTYDGGHIQITDISQLKPTEILLPKQG